MAFKRKLAHGMWEHNFFIQRPRYHRRMISILTYIILLFNGILFFAAMSALIVSDTRPLYKRTAHVYTENISLGDAAVFYASGPSGNLEYRLCAGPVPKTCSDCDDDDSSYDDDDYTYRSYAATGDVGGNSSHDASRERGFGRNNNKTNNNNSSTTNRNNNQTKTQTSNNRLGSRRTDERTAESLCECGWTEDWDACPLSSDPASVFADANNGASCSVFFDELKYIRMLNMIWGAAGMAVPVFIVLPLFYYAVRFMPLAGGCFPPKYMALKPHSYLTPLQALLIVDVFAGLIINGGFLLCQVLVMIATRMMFVTTGDVPSPVSAKKTCGSKSLFAQDFRDDGIFGLWQCAIAGIVFCGISALSSLIVLMWVYISPKPSSFYGLTNRYDVSGSNMPFFPDFEHEPPVNGESRMHGEEHNNETGVGRLLGSGDEGGTTSEQMREHNNNVPVFEFATYQEEKINPMLAL